MYQSWVGNLWTRLIHEAPRYEEPSRVMMHQRASAHDTPYPSLHLLHRLRKPLPLQPSIWALGSSALLRMRYLKIGMGILRVSRKILAIGPLLTIFMSEQNGEEVEASCTAFRDCVAGLPIEVVQPESIAKDDSLTSHDKVDNEEG